MPFMKVLKIELPIACNMTVKASEQLVDAARKLRQQLSSRHAKALFFGAAQGIESGMIQVS